MKTKIIPSRKMQLLLKSLQEQGPIRTLLICLKYFVDYFFDIRYGTDTFSRVEVDSLGIDDDKKEHAKLYQPTHMVPLRKLFTKLKIPAGKVLIDLGCGKGKVLLIASEFGFEEVRGVELSPLLCEIAEKNCSIYRDKTETKTNFVILKSDVLDYKMKDDEDVFYLYNPFDAYILKQVLQKILASVQRRNRKIWIIYRNAEYRDIVKENMNPTETFVYSFWGQDFVVFELESAKGR